jgi:hypothetical protein
MKRCCAREEAENKELHWIDDVLQCVLLASFRHLQLKTKEDTPRLFSLRLVSKQLLRLVTHWLLPRLRYVHRHVFASMPPPWQARLTGLRYLDTTEAALDLTPYTQLRQLRFKLLRHTPLLLPSGLRELILAYAGPQRDLALPDLPQLTKLSLCEGSRFLTLHGLSTLGALHKLTLGLARLAQPAELTRLGRLSSLSLATNRQISNEQLQGLAGQLESLDLSHNARISDVGLTGLTRLRKLNLTHNDLVTEAALYALTQLRALVLDENVNIGSEPLLHMHRLEAISFSRCITLVPRELRRMTQLTSLDLYDAMEPLQERQWMTRLCNLQALCLSGRELITSRWVAAMSSLTYLSLARLTPITKRARLLLNERGGCVRRVDDDAEGD